MPEEHLTNNAILTEEARLPDHVVYRAFALETVVLNLRTAQYHGLNPTSGRMLDVLEKTPTVKDAALRLADEYGRPLPEIEGDLCDLVRGLLERGLIELNTNRQA